MKKDQTLLSIIRSESEFAYNEAIEEIGNGYTTIRAFYKKFRETRNYLNNESKRLQEAKDFEGYSREYK
jgi:hypothetical protein